MCVTHSGHSLTSYLSLSSSLTWNFQPQVPAAFQTIDVLQEHGIAANDLDKLRNAGYYTVESVR
jgi:hypothetical protein